MRVCSIWLLLSVLCLGCNRAEEARRKATVNNLKQLGLALHNYHEDFDGPITKLSHVITAETEYYTSGPQQGRPPDGKFPAGTNVSIVKNSGSYVLVRSDGGVEAYVSADAVKQREDTTTDSSGIVDDSDRRNE